MGKQLRADITGLRAIAVLSVTVYHLVHMLLPQVTWFKGGFLGVDIFFVISGYLMTMIIVRGLSAGNFSLVDFYQRRAKRICPALLVTVLLFGLIGIALIGISDLKRLGLEGCYALLFVSNIYFAQKTDYFGNSALDQVFLHTWSLSVEWQFYLFYPLILMLLRKIIAERLLGRALLIFTALMLVVAIIMTTYVPRASYYLLPSRAFELLFGALAYFYPLSALKSWASQVAGSVTGASSNTGAHARGPLSGDLTSEHPLGGMSTKLRRVLAGYVLKLTPLQVEALGLAVLLISFAVVDDSHGWPTLSAIVPMVGAYLCIAAGNHRSLLRHGVFQKLGLWSYAIYLVHWPLLVMVTKLGFDVWCLELALPILLLGMALHYAVERRRNFGYLFLGCYVLICAGAYYVGSTGLAGRLSYDVTRYAQYGGHTVPFDGKINHIGAVDTRAPDFILIGDSFARHYTLDLIDRGLHVVTVFRDGCYSFATGVTRRTEGYIDEGCRLRYEQAKQAIAQYPNLPVVVAQDWPRYRLTTVLRPKQPQGEYTPVLADDYETVLRADLTQMVRDFSTGYNQIYVVATPRQSVYDVGSTCMYLQALDNPVSRLMARYITCKGAKNLAPIPLNHVLEQTVAALPQNQGVSEYDAPVRYLDPNDAICIDGRCELLVGQYIPVFQDGLHYSWAGSIKVVSYLLAQIGVEQGRVRTEFEDEQVPAESQ